VLGKAAWSPADTFIVAVMYAVLVNTFGLIAEVCLVRSGGSQ
jgi:hypothetical protein